MDFHVIKKSIPLCRRFSKGKLKLWPSSVKKTAAINAADLQGVLPITVRDLNYARLQEAQNIKSVFIFAIYPKKYHCIINNTLKEYIEMTRLK